MVWFIWKKGEREKGNNNELERKDPSRWGKVRTKGWDNSAGIFLRFCVLFSVPRDTRHLHFLSLCFVLYHSSDLVPRTLFSSQTNTHNFETGSEKKTQKISDLERTGVKKKTETNTSRAKNPVLRESINTVWWKQGKKKDFWSFFWGGWIRMFISCSFFVV